MTTVYTFDSSSKTIVQIKEKRGRFCVYRLKEVTVYPKSLTDMKAHKATFTFNKTPSECWDYKPYEDSDVVSDPSLFMKDIERWSPFQVQKADWTPELWRRKKRVKTRHGRKV
tara:strand:+ start:157 stop:495 length:339 start_codon:yes stop_codon:yes gene_type:complete